MSRKTEEKKLKLETLLSQIIFKSFHHIIYRESDLDSNKKKVVH